MPTRLVSKPSSTEDFCAAREERHNTLRYGHKYACRGLPARADRSRRVLGQQDSPFPWPFRIRYLLLLKQCVTLCWRSVLLQILPRFLSAVREALDLVEVSRSRRLAASGRVTERMAAVAITRIIPTTQETMDHDRSLQ